MTGGIFQIFLFFNFSVRAVIWKLIWTRFVLTHQGKCFKAFGERGICFGTVVLRWTRISSHCSPGLPRRRAQYYLTDSSNNEIYEHDSWKIWYLKALIILQKHAAYPQTNLKKQSLILLTKTSLEQQRTALNHHWSILKLTNHFLKV